MRQMRMIRAIICGFSLSVASWVGAPQAEGSPLQGRAIVYRDGMSPTSIPISVTGFTNCGCPGFPPRPIVSLELSGNLPAGSPFSVKVGTVFTCKPEKVMLIGAYQEGGKAHPLGGDIQAAHGSWWGVLKGGAYRMVVSDITVPAGNCGKDPQDPREGK